MKLSPFLVLSQIGVYGVGEHALCHLKGIAYLEEYLNALINSGSKYFLIFHPQLLLIYSLEPALGNSKYK